MLTLQDRSVDKLVQLALAQNQQTQNLGVLPAQSVSQPFNSYFECSVCNQVVDLNPVMCQSCEALFCSTCAPNRENRCPGCQVGFEAVQKLPRFVKDKLESLEFECERCSQKYTYTNRIKHLKENCNSILFKACPAECGATSIKGLQTLKDHF